MTSAETSLARDKKEPDKSFNFDEVVYNWTRTFAETLHMTHEKHYKVTDLESCMIKAIDGFLSCLDPHSGFLDPKTYKSILEATSGEFFGIGIVIDNTRQSKDKYLMVVDTISDGPADKAGIKPFDKIVEIDEEQLEGMNTEEATSKLKGERNTKVQVKVLRENHPDIIALDITRDEIKEQSSTCFYIPDQQIYYLSLNTFSDGCLQQIEKLLNQLKKNPYKGLILDLRNNSGGLLSAAIDIAGLFLDKGSIVVSTKGKGNKEVEKYTTTRNPIINNTIPLFILINHYTASAAEILAGCLKTHSDMLASKTKKDQKKLMVFLVGARTFGKGSVQEVIPISNNCALKITTALYYLPQDSSIQGIGITPDFVIEKRFPPTEQMIWFNKCYGCERALTNYIKLDNIDQDEKKKQPEATKKEKNWTERARDILEKDNQFRETVSLINLFNVAQTCCQDKVGTRTKAVEFMKKIYITDDKLNLVEMKI
jgi:carboxyl-terminal processing protease